MKFQILHNLSKFFYIKIWNSFCNKKNESELYSKVESKTPNLGCDVPSDKTQGGHVCPWSPIVFNIFEVAKWNQETQKLWGNVYRIIQFQKIFSMDNHCHYGMKVWAIWLCSKHRKEDEMQTWLKGKETTLKNDKQ